MQSYSHININIIIVTNIIVLEFLSSRFVHPIVLILLYPFKHEWEHKNNES